MARHPKRPYTLDYVQRLFGEFDELHGDRSFADDPAIVGGVTRLDDRPVMVIGHQKGREVKDKVRRNFGMPKPEGYRKALRLMEMAERFKMPILTFIDTPVLSGHRRGRARPVRGHCPQPAGHVPAQGADRGHRDRRGRLRRCPGHRRLRPSADAGIFHLLGDLPEGCASILWRSADKAPEAAEAMGVGAGRLHELGIVDQVIKEPWAAPTGITTRPPTASAGPWPSGSPPSASCRWRNWWSAATSG